jgi:hypothetical protein
MSLFDEASLIVTPNAYKEGKIFAIKPTDGSGDLSVVRATSATIPKNAQGLVEVPRTNLLLRSEEFNLSPWGALGTIIITPNATTSPDGSLTADLILGADSVATVNQIITGTIGVVYTNSFYIKNNNSTQSQILVRNALSIIDSKINWTGSILTSITNTVGTTSFEDYGNGWYRIISTYTAVEAPQRTRIYPTLNTNQSVYIWGAQLEEGVTATEYIPTTSVIRTKFAGITQDGGSASNIPRLDYTNGSCPSILVEPQRTNLVLRSEEFDNASWLKAAGSFITPNTFESPSGTLTADLLSGVNFNISQNVSVGAGTYTFSVYVKSQGLDIGKEIAVRFQNSPFPQTNITTDGNWQRISVTITVTLTTILSPRVLIFGLTNPVSQIYIWGAQLEAGSNATSYIPTVASTVTRNADIISKTGISSLIGQTEGTMFIETQPLQSLISDGVTRALFSLNENYLSLNLFYLRRINNNYILNVNSLGVTLATLTIFTYSNINLNKLKIAIKYGSNTLKVFVNGVNTVNQTIASVPNTNTLTLGSNRNNGDILDGRIDSFQLYKTQLTDAECIQLTTI